MNKKEIMEFIEEMGRIGDHWEFEEVKRVYGNSSLNEALADRKATVGTFFGIIGKVINR